MSTELLEPTDQAAKLDIDRTRGDFAYPEEHAFGAGTGLSHATIDYISDVKSEPDWIREFRHKALDVFLSKPMPTHWASKDLEQHHLRKNPLLPRERPEAEALVGRCAGRCEAHLRAARHPGAGAQVPRRRRGAVRLRGGLLEHEEGARRRRASIFVSSTEGLKEHPEIFRKWFGKVIPTGDNKFSALNSAVFSGGSFIYVPKGVKVKHPLQAYFRINAENFGQFERTLIIADEGCRGDVHGRLHRAEIRDGDAALRGRRTRRDEGREAPVHHRAELVRERLQPRDQARHRARGGGGEVDRLQHRLAPHDEVSRRRAEGPQGARRSHLHRARRRRPAPGHRREDDPRRRRDDLEHRSARSSRLGKGRSTYRGLVHIPKHLKGCKNNTECDALLINSTSPHRHVSRHHRAWHRQRHAARGERLADFRRADLLHAAARPHRRRRR